MTEPDNTTDPAGASDDAPVRDRTPAPDPAASTDVDSSTTVETEPETFPRAYVEQLRQESAGYRTRAQRADAHAERLMAATVRESVAGILADPTDLPTGQLDQLRDEDGFPDVGKIAAAARELIARKPHLADRRPRGDVDQGARTTSADVDLAGMLRART